MVCLKRDGRGSCQERLLKAECMKWLTSYLLHKRSARFLSSLDVFFVIMAATAQALRTETTAKQAVITSAQSLAVCRNLLKATVGQILYQRGLFDDSAFDLLKMANTTVKCLVR